MSEFNYIIEKIEQSEFSSNPFKHIIIDNFLSDEHFKLITSLDNIKKPVYDSTEQLIEDLTKSGYKVQEFPGCTTSVEDYLTCFNNKKWPTDKGILEGYGLTLRLNDLNNDFLKRLIDFLNSKEFKKSIENKFKLSGNIYVETAIQKYLEGYEISPHPDTRKKAATYMLNINTDSNSESSEIHTYLMKFKENRKYIQTFWEGNESIDRCWVPWNWCEKVITTNKNNSIVFFAPNNDTLHAVKLNYNHLNYQRTQIYGNLWYNSNPSTEKKEYLDIDLLKSKEVSKKSLAKRVIQKLKKTLHS